MLTASIFGLHYCRLLTDTLSVAQAAALTTDFDYTFAVCYSSCMAPGYEKVQKNACLLDLSKGLDHVFSGFHATTRTHVRRSEKIEGLSFEMGFGDDFEAYFDFYKKCELARGWFPMPAEELRNSSIISAFFEGEPISGMSAYFHGDRLRIGRIYSLKNNPQNPRMTSQIFGCAAKRIVFEYCRYGVERGFQTFDLSGVDLKDPSKAGIARFKLSFGGAISPVIIARLASSKFKAIYPKIQAAGFDIT